MVSKDTIMKLLADRGIKMYDESEFVMNADKKPKGTGLSITYFACRAEKPEIGGRVSIKVPWEADSKDMRIDCAGEETWLYFKRECCILKRHEAHPNIQKCLGVVNQFGRSLLPGLVSKDVAVGYLKAFVFEDERATNRTKVQLMRDVANGLAILHEQRILHRNLKSSNILVDVQDGNLTALLSDFLCAKDFDDMLPEESDLRVRQTVPWMPPENLVYYYDSKNHNDKFDNGASDMWAFGCTMLEVLACTECIWPNDYDGGEAERALKEGKRPPRPYTFPPWDEAWNFIHDRCWVLDPSKRITAREAVVELEELLESAPS